MNPARSDSRSRLPLYLRMARLGLVGFLLLGALATTAVAGAQEATATPVDSPTDAPIETPTEPPTAEPTVAVPPTIQSDKADYAPGETVTLTGANWAPGELVLIFVND